jgi:hypothetical protein
MATIGNWGDIVKFQTSDRRILTLDKLKYSTAVRVQKHNLINGWPIVEFVGPDLQETTFTIELNALLGVRPREIEDKLWYSMIDGIAAPLVLGGRNVCARAMLTKMSASYNVILKRGEIFSETIDLSMIASYR